ncbi:MAG: hypothetical protein IKW81_14065 [Pseudobutyrivibrio sp.]|nr:hypothetical protein [Pseudobutyrivibrio sp.]
MKTWNTPAIEEVSFVETKQGGTTTVVLDGIIYDDPRYPGEPVGTFES